VLAGAGRIACGVFTLKGHSKANVPKPKDRQMCHAPSMAGALKVLIADNAGSFSIIRQTKAAGRWGTGRLRCFGLMIVDQTTVAATEPTRSSMVNWITAWPVLLPAANRPLWSIVPGPLMTAYLVAADFIIWLN
jgi:hypothetical protein